MEQGNRAQAIFSLSITIFLGVAFLAGVLGIEWRIAPFGPPMAPRARSFIR